jgi:chromate transporter
LKDRLVPLALAFLKLGFTAFGGPVAAYAMMRAEFVIRRKWLSEDGFFDFLGVANLVPGPNATELAILIGNHVAGWRGFIVAGICYIFPAMLTVLGLAWIYVQFGTLPALEGVLFGIKPVVVEFCWQEHGGFSNPVFGTLRGWRSRLRRDWLIWLGSAPFYYWLRVD